MGDRVRTRVENSSGHSRLPRYAQGRGAVVEAVHAAYPLPERTVAGDSDREPVPVYTVAFDAPALWGRSAETHSSVRVEVWENDLEADDDRFT